MYICKVFYMCCLALIGFDGGSRTKYLRDKQKKKLRDKLKYGDINELTFPEYK